MKFIKSQTSGANTQAEQYSPAYTEVSCSDAKLFFPKLVLLQKP
ncbi:MAG: hypothetical protein BAJALOKI1v1_400024 [Promethearchaeota archaeon]|nr:MAG: hypothetical protein BAJALOKI1v1_400024 [Candidatus Lokiarchaeota archaeon]